MIITFNNVFRKGFFIFRLLNNRLTDPYIHLNIPTTHITLITHMTWRRLHLLLRLPHIPFHVLRRINPLRVHVIIIEIIFILLMFSCRLRSWWYLSKLARFFLLIPFTLLRMGWKICNQHDLLAKGALKNSILFYYAFQFFQGLVFFFKFLEFAFELLAEAVID